MVKGNVTRRAALGGIVGAAAAPQVSAAQLAADQATDVIDTQRVFVDLPLKNAEAATAEGQFFKLVDTADGAVAVYRRDAKGSTHLYDEATRQALASTDTGKGAALVGFRQVGTGSTDNDTREKLLERAVTLLDYAAKSDHAGIIAGTTAADAAFAAMMAAAVAEGRPARITKGSYKLTAQTSLSAGLALFLEDGAELFSEDDTIESLLLVEADDVSIYGSAGARLRMPTTNDAGRVGCCLVVRGADGVRLHGLNTQSGKWGIVLLDNDNLEVANCIVRSSYNWAFAIGGNRYSRFHACGVIETRDIAAADAFKVFGKYAPDGVTWSTRSSYSLSFSDCFAINVGAGQAFDIISTVDENDDLYDIAVSDPVGINCASGLLEIKLDENSGGGSFTNWPVHDITVTGGKYFGDGTEIVGIYIADRVYNIDINGTKINNVEIGVNVANPARLVRLRSVTTNRTSQEGIKWESSAGAGQGCIIDSPTVIDPNYGQGASTYSGINLTSGDTISNVRIVNPTVLRSPVTSGSAHPYAISIGATCSDIMIEGVPNLIGHATAAIDNDGTNTRWPETFSIEINLAGGSAAFNKGITNLKQTFYACRIRLSYIQASNIGRDITLRHRSTAGSTDIGTAIATSATAVLWEQAAAQTINPPQRCATTQPVVVASVGADGDYPGSPTGIVILTLEGFYDGASA